MDIPQADSYTPRPGFFPNRSNKCMGKGDIKSRRGKIYRGSFGKSRPKDPDKKKAAAVKALKK
jgi:30S ribosomal protein S31